LKFTEDKLVDFGTTPIAIGVVPKLCRNRLTCLL
jgi:hypothetical protein